MAEKEKKPQEAKEEIKKEVETKKEEKLEEKVEEKTEYKKEKSTPAVAKKTKKSKEEAPVVTLEREYIIPLKRDVLKVPRYRRAKKAIAVIRKFIVRHMRVEDRDVKKVKIDLYLNNEVWFRGIKKPANKIKVKAIKNSDGTVRVELAELPDAVKFAKARHDKQKALAAVAKVKKPKRAEKEKEPASEEDKKDEEEKEKSSVEAGLARQEKAAKDLKHTAKGAHKQKTTPVRKSLKK